MEARPMRSEVQVIEQSLQANSRALKEPELIIAVGELAESSVPRVVSLWVETADDWPVCWDPLEQIKLQFDSAGIEISFPLMSLHMKPNKDET
jgi:small conductance mechanosensitive channel